MNSHSIDALDPDPHETDADPKHSAEGLAIAENGIPLPVGLS